MTLLTRLGQAKARKRPGSGGRRHSSSLMIPAAMAFTTMTATASGYSGIAQYRSHRQQVSQVAVKIGELHEKHRQFSVRGLSFSPDGQTIAADSGFASIEIWNWRSGRAQSLDAPVGFGGGPVVDPVQYSPDGRLLAVCGWKGVGNVAIRVWNTSDWSVLRDIVDSEPGGCRSMAFTPDGKFLVYAGYRVLRPSDLVAYATDSWRVAWRIELGAWPHISVEPQGLAANPDGRLLGVSATVRNTYKSGPSRQEQTVYIVDNAARAIVRKYNGDAGGPLAWSPNGSRLAVAMARGGFETLDATSGKPIVNQSMPEAAHMYVRFTADSRYLVESDSNGQGTGLGVGIWSGEGEKLLQKVRGDSASIALSRDGKFLAIGGLGFITIWQFK